MSIFGRMSFRCQIYRRCFSSAKSCWYPIPRDLLSGSAPRSDLESNVDRRPMQLNLTVKRLIHRGDLNTAAEYARLAYSRLYCDSTAETCDSIIGAMCEAKRYTEAFDLFHYFYNELEMGSKSCSPSYIIKALCDLGRVDDALVFRSKHLSHCCPYWIIKGLVDEGRLDEALSLARKSKVPPLAWSNLISGFLKIGNLHMADDLMKEFESNIDYKSEFEAPLVRLLPFIEHSFDQGKDEEAMRYYQSLMCNKDKGVNVCEGTGKELLKLLLKYGKTTEAWNFFHRMLDGFDIHVDIFGGFRFHTNVDSETIDIMLEECFKEGRVKEGIETVYKVKAKVGRLKPGSYRKVITWCCEQGMLSVAESLLAEYSDITIYRAMMKAYVKAGRLDDALLMVNKLADGGLRIFALDIQCND